MHAEAVPVHDRLSRSKESEADIMRVLLISHTCQTWVEGRIKVDRLARLPGLEVLLVVPDRWFYSGKWHYAEPPASGPFRCEVRRIAWAWAGPAQNFLHWYPGLGRLVREFQPDVIDLWEEPWGLVSAQVCRLRNRFAPHAKLITETEQNIIKNLPPPFEAWRSYTLRQADFAVGRSSEAVEVLRTKGYRGPAAVVPNAVDVSLFRPLDRCHHREVLGLNGFVVGYVGRLVEEKGLADLIDALPFCPEDVNLVLVGSGPMRSALEQRAEALGRRRQVRFLEARPLDQLPGLMTAFDTLALVSRTTPRWKEQFGRVIIEAHACETPVIGSCSGAIPEVVGQGGLLVPEQNPPALGEAITRLRDNPGLGRLLGHAGRRQVEQNTTWECAAARMAEIYAEVTARKAAA